MCSASCKEGRRMKEIRTSIVFTTNSGGAALAPEHEFSSSDSMRTRARVPRYDSRANLRMRTSGTCNHACLLAAPPTNCTLAGVGGGGQCINCSYWCHANAERCAQCSRRFQVITRGTSERESGQKRVLVLQHSFARKRCQYSLECVTSI